MPNSSHVSLGIGGGSLLSETGWDLLGMEDVKGMVHYAEHLSSFEKLSRGIFRTEA